METDHANPPPPAREQSVPATPAVNPRAETLEPERTRIEAAHRENSGTGQAVSATGAEQTVQGLLSLGDTLAGRGDYQASEIAYRQIMEGPQFQRADKATACLGLARMYRRQASLTRAVAVYEKFVKEFANDERVPDALLELGRSLRALGANKLAISRFYSVINSTLKVSPSAFDHYQLLAKTAQFEIAETHYACGDYAEAAKFFSRLRLLDLAPADHARAHFKSACAFLFAGEKDAAVTTLRSYLDLWPNEPNVPEAYHLLAVTLRELNRPQEALTATLDLLRVSRSRSASDPAGWAYWQRRTGNQLANAFFEQGDTNNALILYQNLAAMSDAPEWRLPINYQIALCYERLRDTELARKTYQSIIDAQEKPVTARADELGEIARMCRWRLEHLAWAGDIERDLTTLFATTTGQRKAPPAPPPPSDDSNGSTPAAPEAVR